MINTQVEALLSTEEMQLLAQARATFSSLLSVHFLNIPDTDFSGKLRQGEFTQSLELLANETDVHPDIAAGAGRMLAFLAVTQDQPPETLAQTLGIDRTRLYRGVSPQYGPPPPYEAEWVSTQDKSGALQQIAAIYHESGMMKAPEANERLDYIGIELAYIEQMAGEELRRWQSGESEQASQYYALQKSFTLEHLAKWVPAFVEKALEYAQTDFYRGHLFMLRGFIAEQVEIYDELSQAS